MTTKEYRRLKKQNTRYFKELRKELRRSGINMKKMSFLTESVPRYDMLGLFGVPTAVNNNTQTMTVDAICAARDLLLFVDTMSKATYDMGTDESTAVDHFILDTAPNSFPLVQSSSSVPPSPVEEKQKEDTGLRHTQD